MRLEGEIPAIRGAQVDARQTLRLAPPSFHALLQRILAAADARSHQLLRHRREGKLGIGGHALVILTSASASPRVRIARSSVWQWVQLQIEAFCGAVPGRLANHSALDWAARASAGSTRRPAR